MATPVFAKTLKYLQHLIWLIPESQSYTLNSIHKNIRTRTTCDIKYENNLALMVIDFLPHEHK
jgi:hypothetical protein